MGWVEAWGSKRGRKETNPVRKRMSWLLWLSNDFDEGGEDGQ